MYSKILVATDGSDLSERGLKTAATLSRLTGASLTVVTVTQVVATISYGSVGTGLVDIRAAEFAAADAHAKAVLDAAREILAGAGLTADLIHVQDREPADGIIETAEKTGSDLIVMGSHGRRTALRRTI